MDQVEEKPTTGVANLKRISKFEGMQLVHQLSTCFHTISSFFFNEHISSIEFQLFFNISLFLHRCSKISKFHNPDDELAHGACLFVDIMFGLVGWRFPWRVGRKTVHRIPD